MKRMNDKSLNQTAEELRHLRQHQPRVTLAEAQEQAKRVREAREKQRKEDERRRLDNDNVAFIPS